ncbi:hypothetical protein Dvul_2478 [Nitratidesulfovibrio vulgaris DP4]|uniref:Uncharacterized protein n=1 Tax=Nitratidesulfovibrio vulgaris (strain DP4) TaxID=391774 RepID=A0A0H3ACI3_NITV4|nr:hypothetical protein Dvul_2478 [Nitratidesulfovibrio vulgaris DP4]
MRNVSGRVPGYSGSLRRLRRAASPLTRTSRPCPVALGGRAGDGCWLSVLYRRGTGGPSLGDVIRRQGAGGWAEEPCPSQTVSFEDAQGVGDAPRAMA